MDDFDFVVDEAPIGGIYEPRRLMLVNDALPIENKGDPSYFDSSSGPEYLESIVLFNFFFLFFFLLFIFFLKMNSLDCRYIQSCAL